MRNFVYAALAAVAVAVEKPVFDIIPQSSVVKAKLESYTINMPKGGTAP